MSKYTEILFDLRVERDRIDTAIRAIEALEGKTARATDGALAPRPPLTRKHKHKRRNLSTNAELVFDTLMTLGAYEKEISVTQLELSKNTGVAGGSLSSVLASLVSGGILVITERDGRKIYKLLTNVLAPS